MAAQQIPNPHKNPAEWLAWKCRKIGGHAAVTLAGASYSASGEKHYQTPNELYDRIVHGVVSTKTEEDEAFLSWRLGLEPNIADRYALETGRKLRKCGSTLHPESPMLVCSPDREILKDSRGVGLLEIKSRDPIVWNQIKLSGAPGADWVQTQFYLMVRGLRWGAICEANVSSGKQIRFDIEADPDFHKVLYQRITEFLEDCAAGKRPPEVIPDPVRLPAVGGELVTVEQMDETLLRQFKGIADGVTQARDLLDRAKTYHDGVKDAAQKWLLINEIDVVEGFGLRVYYKEQKGRLTLDKKALVRAHPEIDLSQYEKRGNPFRSFRVFDRPKLITNKGDRK